MCGPGSLFRAGLGSGAQTFCPPCRGQVCGPPGSAGPFLEPRRRGVRVLPQGPGIPGAAPERRLPLTAPNDTGTLSSGARSQALPSPLQLRESWLRPLSGEGCFVPTENLLDSVAPSGTLSSAFRSTCCFTGHFWVTDTASFPTPC